MAGLAEAHEAASTLSAYVEEQPVQDGCLKHHRAWLTHDMVPTMDFPLPPPSPVRVVPQSAVQSQATCLRVEWGMGEWGCPAVEVPLPLLQGGGLLTDVGDTLGPIGP